ncbi:hypothetical protein HFO56_34115 [Rhizobium laguerreae]|uniref:hypothetical protein n=1 Tax=Rhizobium laguerreae TaxID=1076926 RepID=UPI001C8FF92C|nr:hypothetical protein [Rhizobium laguerreae]MBY3157363.1 hypothetical protein [Rhizobium laguerreae]
MFGSPAIDDRNQLVDSYPFLVYLFLWIILIPIALVGAAVGRRITFELRYYRAFLCIPWKLAVFIPAALFVTLAGQFAFDDTWDVVTGGGMSLLTYLTAPWSVAVACLVATGRRPLRHGFIALVACLFSASWFYDGWLLLRDGSYTPMWLPNLLLSPFLYVAGGTLWNLEIDAQGRPIFGFSEKTGPPRQERRRSVGGWRWCAYRRS